MPLVGLFPARPSPCRIPHGSAKPKTGHRRVAGTLVDFMIQFSEREPGAVIRWTAFWEAVSQANKHKRNPRRCKIEDRTSDFVLLASLSSRANPMQPRDCPIAASMQNYNSTVLANTSSTRRLLPAVAPQTFHRGPPLNTGPLLPRRKAHSTAACETCRKRKVKVRTIPRMQANRSGISVGC
jgi:hypothetical protein